jgi:hypothetical protein
MRMNVKCDSINQCDPALVASHSDRVSLLWLLRCKRVNPQNNARAPYCHYNNPYTFIKGVYAHEERLIEQLTVPPRPAVM